MDLFTSMLLVLLISNFAVSKNLPENLVKVSSANLGSLDVSSQTDEENDYDVISTEVTYQGSHQNAVYFRTYLPFNSELVEFTARKTGKVSFANHHGSSYLPVHDNDLFNEENLAAMSQMSLSRDGSANFVTNYRVNDNSPKKINKIFNFIDIVSEDPRQFTITIKSSNFEFKDYPDNSNHVWYLRCHEGYSFNFNVTEFDLETDLDQITLLSTLPNGNKNVIKEIGSTGLVKTNTNHLEVTFKSDCDITKRGFRASIEIVEAYLRETTTSLPEVTTIKHSTAFPEITSAYVYETAQDNLETTTLKDTMTSQEINSTYFYETTKHNLVSGRDCKSIKESDPSAETGRYMIDPGIEVVCEMNVDGGGWQMFQRRYDGSVNFTQNWNKYSEGFGSLDNEFWLGLENVYKITKDSTFELRIVMQDYNGVEKFAQYNNFKISESSDYYRLTFNETSYTGDAGDALSYHNNMPFSTYDADHDADHDKNCVTLWSSGGGNWMKNCYSQNLNGLFKRSGHRYSVMFWHYFDENNNYHQLKSSIMMFRRTS